MSDLAHLTARTINVEESTGAPYREDKVLDHVRFEGLPGYQDRVEVDGNEYLVISRVWKKCMGTYTAHILAERRVTGYVREPRGD